MKFHTCQTIFGGFTWYLNDGDGRVVARSADSFAKRSEATAAVESLAVKLEILQFRIIHDRKKP